MTPEDMLIELKHWLASGAPVILRLHRLVRTAAEPEVITHRPHEPLGDGDLTPEQLEGMDMWDRDVMLAERHRAIGALLVHRAVTELRRHRAMVARLGSWAGFLESCSPNHYEMTQREIAAELRNCMGTP